MTPEEERRSYEILTRNLYISGRLSPVPYDPDKITKADLFRALAEILLPIIGGADALWAACDVLTVKRD